MASALGDDDLHCIDDLMADFRTVSGRTALAHALYRRWTSDRGSLLDDPNYGTNLTDWINEDVGTGTIPAIIAAACAEARKDQRVVDISGEGELLDSGVLMLKFEVEDGEGPFTLTISVDDVTIELLDIQEAA